MRPTLKSTSCALRYIMHQC